MSDSFGTDFNQTLHSTSQSKDESLSRNFLAEAGDRSRLDDVTVQVISSFNLTDEIRKDFSQLIQKVSKSVGVALGVSSIKSLLSEFIRTREGARDIETKPKAKFGLLMNRDRTEAMFPLDLEKFADDALIIKALTFLYKFPHVKLSFGVGSINPIEDVSLSNFLSGYFSELTSREEVKHILLQKDKPFQNGRACARYELLLAATSDENQKHIVNIGEGIANKDKKNRGRLEVVVYSNYAENERAEVLSFLKSMARVVSDADRVSLRKKIQYGSFFPSFEVLVSQRKRHGSKELATKKKGKGKTVTINLDPSKPSLLSTIAPFERAAVKELWESCYQDRKNLKERYEACVPFEADISQYLEKIQILVNQSWVIKNKVFKMTRRREVCITRDGVRNTQESIAATKQKLLRVDNEESYAEFLEEERETFISWIPLTADILDEGNVKDEIRESVFNGKIKRPEVLRLLSIETRVRAAAEKARDEEAKRVVSFATENKFENLERDAW